MNLTIYFLFYSDFIIRIKGKDYEIVPVKILTYYVRVCKVIMSVSINHRKYNVRTRLNIKKLLIRTETID